MSKTLWLASLFLAAHAAAAPVGPKEAETTEAAPPSVVFAQSNDVFSPLLADPREIQLGVQYYRQYGNDVGDVALGHSWGMSRWYSRDRRWAFQWDIEGMAYSRFLISGSVNKFETVDFIGRVPIEVRHDWASGKFMLFHQSSHLGDDYIRDTGNKGFRYSIDGLRGELSADLTDWARVYGGGTYLLHSVPSPKHGALQSGFELMSHDMHYLRQYTVKYYAAQDFQWWENVGWNANSNSVIGVRLGQPLGHKAMRLELGYFAGHSPYGQFFANKEHYADLKISFDL